MNIASINSRLSVRLTLVTVAAAAATAILGAFAMVARADASQSVDATVRDQVLRIKGTRNDDQLTLRLKAGDANVLEVDAGDDGTADFSLNRTSFGAIAVNARGGNDLIRVDEANGPVTEPTLIRGGHGNDTILGGSAIETIEGGAGDDFIDGNRANDVAFMGNGDDIFRWDPGDASDVVEGGSGDDTLLFNGANGGETVDLSSDGERLIFFRNPGGITMDMNDVEVSAFNAIGGQDTITVNDLTGTDASRVDINLDAALATGVGDGIADRVIANGTAGNDSIVVTGSAGNVSVAGLSATVAIRSAEFANDRLDITTAAGDDTVDSSGLAAGVIQLFVDDPAAP